MLIDLQFIYFYVVLRIKPSASRMPGKHSTTEQQPQPSVIFFQGLKQMILNLSVLRNQK